MRSRVQRALCGAVGSLVVASALAVAAEPDGGFDVKWWCDWAVCTTLGETHWIDVPSGGMRSRVRRALCGAAARLEPRQPISNTGWEIACIRSG